MKIQSATAGYSGNNIDNNLNPETNTVRKSPESQSRQVPAPGQTGNLQTKNIDKDEIETAVKIANEAFNEVSIGFRYSIDKKTNTEVIQVVSTENGEVIRQYPPKEILNMLARIYDRLGILVDKKV
ncbi:MAG: flagellar protein FlaG [Bacillota bacterium]